MRDELLATLATIAEEVLQQPILSFDESLALREDLGMDSIDMFDVLANLEKKFQISVRREDFARVCTVGQFLDVLLERYLSGAERLTSR